eukprot:SAG31_NODE_7017_length_1816_cov_1.220151_3_plen_37_part_01
MIYYDILIGIVETWPRSDEVRPTAWTRQLQDTSDGGG